jgi:RHS repeat-associated protein
MPVLARNHITATFTRAANDDCINGGSCTRTKYTYDSRNRVQTYKDPAGKVATYNYDGMSNLTSVVDRKNQTTSVTYDGINRPTLITYQDGSTIAITWDGGNRATKFVDSLNGTISRTYDGLDRLTQETSPQGTVSYQYDAAGRRQTMTATGEAVVNYTFDNDNRLTQVAQGTTTLGFGYDAASRRTSVTLPNGIVGTYGFDNANELTGITYANGSTQVGTLTYGYDLAGRRTSVGGTLAGFVPPAYVAAMSYDGTNRLTNWGGTSLSYDADGNLTGFGATTYTWNARNQMIATSAGSATFGYDALGRRVSATVSGATSSYLYDGLNTVVTGSNLMMASGNLDEIFAQVGSSTTTSYFRDGINSTSALTSNSASISANYYYSPYGDSAKTGSAATALQYTGRENDGATGLYYYRARYYSPQLGRFISEDPLNVLAGTNFYAYVLGNPIEYRDPHGRDPLAAGIGFLGGLLYGTVSGLIEGKSAEDIAINALEDASIGGLTGLTDGLNLVGRLSLNAAINGAGEAYKEEVDILSTGCGRLSGARIGLAAASGLLGDLGGKLVALSAAERATAATHVVQASSDVLETIAGTNISGILSLVPSTIQQVFGH